MLTRMVGRGQPRCSNAARVNAARVIATPAILIAAPLLLAAAPDDSSRDAASPIIITELLYNVPPGMDGDATADGTRDAVGDEFIELHNISDQPVSLRGWTITNRLRSPRDDADHDTSDADSNSKTGGKQRTPSTPRAARGVSFTFPTFDLPPRGTVVVFNGLDSKIPGPAGDARKAPSKPNDNFSGAYVFTMDNEAKFNAFNNTADYALLSDKSGRPIECILWGKPDADPPASTPRTTTVKGDPKGSITREPSNDDDLIPHCKLDGTPLSPGRIAKRDLEKEPPRKKPDADE